jgi:hypothetical protein
MRADPEPHDIGLVAHGQCPVVQANSHGTEATDFLEV